MRRGSFMRNCAILHKRILSEFCDHLIRYVNARVGGEIDPGLEVFLAG